MPLRSICSPPLKGFEDGTYNSAGSYTREQFAKILYVLVNGKDDNAAMYQGTAPFPDVDADRWSAGYITWAVNLGICNGRDDGNFWPTDVVKYAEACKMFLIAMGYSSTIYTTTTVALRTTRKLTMGSMVFTTMKTMWTP